MAIYEVRSQQEQVSRSLLRAWTRKALILTATLAYALGFAPLYGSLEIGVVALAVLPVAATGFLLGLRAGLLFGLISIPLNTLSLQFAGQPGLNMLMFERVPGPLTVALIGVVAGWLRELLERMQIQSQQLVAEQAQLQAEVAKRAQVEEAGRVLERKLLETQKAGERGEQVRLRHCKKSLCYMLCHPLTCSPAHPLITVCYTVP